MTTLRGGGGGTASRGVAGMENTIMREEEREGQVDSSMSSSVATAMDEQFFGSTGKAAHLSLTR